MLYGHHTDLPEALQRTMPIEAQELYRTVYNAAWKQYEHTFQEVEALSADELAHRIAWGRVKQRFSKDCQGQWHSKSEPTLSKEEPYED
jgi:cation transport regulator ChaB